jgi:hypothetical protein
MRGPIINEIHCVGIYVCPRDHYSYYGEVNEDFWTSMDDEDDEMFEGRGKRRARSLRLSDKESILNRYKLMQVQLQDRNGNFFTVRRKVK